MKIKLFVTAILFIFSVVVFAQTQKDTTVVTIETLNGGNFTGHIVSETGDSIKIETKDFGLIAIAKNDLVRNKLYTIETVDGNAFIGEIISEDSQFVKIKTDRLGEVSIRKSDIKKRELIEVQQIKDGKYWFPNPQSTRYFWSPNGFGLKKGEGYYQNIWVLWNQFAYGASDYFSFGGGIIPLFLFAGSPTPVFLTAKFSIPVVENKFNLGAGGIVGTVLGEENTGFGIFYGLSTFGNPDNNVTVGMGYGFAGGEWAKSPMINVNGMFRVSSRGYFITENYIISAEGEGVVIISLGGRSIIKKAALDYGLILPLSSDFDGFIALPWLGFTLPFGKTN